MEPYQDEPLLSVVGAVAEGVDWISESSESAGENEIEIVASTSTVLADNGKSSSQGGLCRSGRCIKLSSTDGLVFKISTEVASWMKTITAADITETMLDPNQTDISGEDDSPVPVVMADGRVLRQVIRWCLYHIRQNALNEPNTQKDNLSDDDDDDEDNSNKGGKIADLEDKDSDCSQALSESDQSLSSEDLNDPLQDRDSPNDSAKMSLPKPQSDGKYFSRMEDHPEVCSTHQSVETKSSSEPLGKESSSSQNMEPCPAVILLPGYTRAKSRSESWGHQGPSSQDKGDPSPTGTPEKSARTRIRARKLSEERGGKRARREDDDQAVLQEPRQREKLMDIQADRRGGSLLKTAEEEDKGKIAEKTSTGGTSSEGTSMKGTSTVRILKRTSKKTSKRTSTEGTTMQTDSGLVEPKAIHEGAPQREREAGGHQTEQVEITEAEVMDSDDSDFDGRPHKFYDQFFEVDNATLYQLLETANFLNIPHLMNAGCRQLARKLRDKTTAEMIEAMKIE